MASEGNAISMTFISNIPLSKLNLDTWVFDNSDQSFNTLGWFKKEIYSIRIINDFSLIKDKYLTSNVLTEGMIEEGDEKHVLSILQNLLKDLEGAGCYECSITKLLPHSDNDD